MGKNFLFDLFSSIKKLSQHYFIHPTKVNYSNYHHYRQNKCFLLPHTEESHPRHQENKIKYHVETHQHKKSIKNKKIQPNDNSEINKVREHEKESYTKKQDKKGNEKQQIEVNAKNHNQYESKSINHDMS